MLDRISQVESVILKGIGIIAAVALVAYALLSVVGNIVLNRQADPESGYPSKGKAPYQLTITTTGQLIFTKKYEVLKNDDPQIYRLPSGFYITTDKGEVDYLKPPLELNERIWGEIVVKKR